jgi:hypothetical protein
MNRRWVWRIAGAAVAASAIVLAVVFWLLPSSAGPLQTLMVGGQPYEATSGGGVITGQPDDLEAYVFNHARDPVRVTGVSAVTVPGVPAGRFVHGGIQTTGSSIASAAGWPIPGVPVRPLIGAELPPGKSGIIVAFLGTEVGRAYGGLGLRITYTYHGTSYAMRAWAGFDYCPVTPKEWKSDYTKVCPDLDAFENKINADMMARAG